MLRPFSTLVRLAARSATAIAVVACCATAASAQGFEPPALPFNDVFGFQQTTAGLVLVSAERSAEPMRTAVWRVDPAVTTWTRLATVDGEPRAWAAAGNTALLLRYDAPPLRSIDGGRSWQETTVPFGRDNDSQVRVLATGNRWLAFTQDTLWISRDAARSWRAQAAGRDTEWSGATPDAFASGRDAVFILDGRRVLRSRDHGQTWAVVKDDVRSSDARLAAGNNAVVLVDGFEVWWSEDGGDRWRRFAVPADTRERGYFAPVAAATDGVRTIIVSRDCRIDETHDRGATWTTTRCRGGHVYRTTSIAVSRDGAVFVNPGTDRPFARSAGGRWRAVRVAPLPWSSLYAVRAVGASLLAVGTGGAVLESDDEGRSWSEHWEAVGEPLPNLRDVAGRQGLLLGIGFETNSIARSSDGRAWRADSRSSPWPISIAYGAGQTVIASLDGDLRASQLNLYRRGDAEDEWEKIERPSGGRCSPPSSGVVRWTGRAFIADGCGVFYRSTDGRTWTLHGHEWHVGGAKDIWTDDEGLISAHQTGALLRSTDDGRTWTLLRAGPSPDLAARSDFLEVFAVARAGRTLVTVGDRGIERSDDGGTTWQSIPDSPRGLDAVWGRGRTFVAVGGKDIFRSEDAGRTWQRVPCCRTP